MSFLDDNLQGQQVPDLWTQAKSLQLQKLQAGLAEADQQLNEGTLFPAEHYELKAAITDQMTPLLRLQEQTQTAAKQKSIQDAQEQLATATSLQNANQVYSAENFRKHVATFTDPLSGDRAHFYQEQPGTWKQVAMPEKDPPSSDTPLSGASSPQEFAAQAAVGHLGEDQTTDVAGWAVPSRGRSGGEIDPAFVGQAAHRPGEDPNYWGRDTLGEFRAANPPERLKALTQWLQSLPDQHKPSQELAADILFPGQASQMMQSGNLGMLPAALATPEQQAQFSQSRQAGQAGAPQPPTLSEAEKTMFRKEAEQQYPDLVPPAEGFRSPQQEMQYRHEVQRNHKERVDLARHLGDQLLESKKVQFLQQNINTRGADRLKEKQDEFKAKQAKQDEADKQWHADYRQAYKDLVDEKKSDFYKTMPLPDKLKTPEAMITEAARIADAMHVLPPSQRKKAGNAPTTNQPPNAPNPVQKARQDFNAKLQGATPAPGAAAASPPPPVSKEQWGLPSSLTEAHATRMEPLIQDAYQKSSYLTGPLNAKALHDLLTRVQQARAEKRPLTMKERQEFLANLHYINNPELIKHLAVPE